MSEAQVEFDEDLEVEVVEASEEQEPVKTPDGYISLDDHQKDVNKQHRKYRDEERSRLKVEAEAEKLRKELEAFKAKSVDLTVPPIPDPYDSDYQDKIKARDEAIQRRAKHESEADKLQERQAQANEQKELDRREIEKAKVDTFDSNMVRIGLAPAEVKRAADTLVDYGVSDTLSDIILEDEDGPLLAMYLHQNPIELDQFNSMSIAKLFTALPTLKKKASLLKPKTSKAPDPPDILKGGGVPESESPLLKGVIYE